MSPISRIRFLLHITHTHGIARRYFVVNGFDGALTMLGLITGFYVSGSEALDIIISACLGAAIALGMSGLTSAYISEAAERKKELSELEEAMGKDLGTSAHGEAARLVPFLIALVNGLAPLLISLLIITPIWLTLLGLPIPWQPLPAAIAVALGLIFLLGVFLGRISGTLWLWSGLQTLAIALFTALLILLLGQ